MKLTKKFPSKTKSLRCAVMVQPSCLTAICCRGTTISPIFIWFYVIGLRTGKSPMYSCYVFLETIQFIPFY